MFSIKKIPIWMILILILIAIIVVYEVASTYKEGLTQDQMVYFSNAEPGQANVEALGEVTFPQPFSVNTGAKPKKLYNNIFYFTESGKLAVVFPNEENDAIAKIKVYKRDLASEGEVVEYKDPNFVIDAEGTIADKYKSWYTKPPNFVHSNPNIVNNQIFVAQFGKKTYIHIICLATSDGSKKHFGFFTTTDSISNRSDGLGTPQAINSVPVASFTPGPVVNKVISTEAANPITISSAYQVYKNIFFNEENGDLYIAQPKGESEGMEQGDPAGNQGDGGDSQPDADSGASDPTGAEAAGSETFKTIEGEENMDMILKKYDRSGTEISTFSTGSSPSSFDGTWMKPDNVGGNYVVYVGNSKNTMILILHKETNGSYKLVQVARFGVNGIIVGPDDDVNSQPEEQSFSNDDASGNNASTGIPQAQLFNENNISDYYKWYWYWNQQSTGNMPVHFSEDYMLKTQVVPPVCPACPSCGNNNGNGCCNNCGGNGGSGTMDASGNSIVKETGKNTPVSDAYSKTLDTTSDLLKSGGSGAVGLTKDTLGLGKDAVTGAAGMATDAVTGSVGLATDAVTGSVGLAKDTVTGGVGLAKDTVTGTLDYAGSALSGTADFITGLGSGPTQISGQNQMGQGAQGGIGGVNQQSYGYGQTPVSSYGAQTAPLTTTDPYTYNGQLPQKPPSNYLPRTADFSAFAK